MKKREAKRQMRFAGAIAVLALITGVILSTLLFFSYADAEGGKPAATLEGSELLSDLMEKTTHFVVVKHKQLGASHYAYTDALAETNGDPAPHSEYVFNPGSQLVLLTLSENEDGSVSTYEQELLNSRRGVIRDPDVNPEGTKILFSHKTTDSDDYHLYEMDIATKNVTQLTFGSGHSDIEPKYLANGNIVFNSNRDVQTVDCWYTPVCNLYILYRESGSIVRVGYDQVHTTYPTVTSDGRILYTRWDYNDRTQMYVQSLFQMFQDGTNQTEVYGNGSNFPTTLLHTREVPGETGVYLSIASGHHMYQYGKPVLVDTSKGRNDDAAVTFLFPDQYTREKPDNVDTGHYASEGKIYKYPYALNSDEYLISTAKKYDGVKTAFDICLMNRKGESVTLVKGSTALPASQIVPIMGTKLFNRPSAVNYASSTGTYYVANVYDGEGMKGVEKGSAKYLRVVELVYRQAAIGATIGSGTGSSDPYSPIATGNGAWDVKAVLGVVPIEEDGSALFRVPADTPVYFQILDDKGDMIQSMRSWTTLMPGETFSCVGCHEEKNQVPPASAGVTLAMQKGVQDLQKDLWMEENEEYAAFDPYEDKAIGFSYLRQVQTIFNESCVSCHSNTDAALAKIKAGDMTNAEASIRAAGELIPAGAVWSCTSEASDSRSVRLPIGKLPSMRNDVNTAWNGERLTLEKSFKATRYDAEGCHFLFTVRYSGNMTISVNGKEVVSSSSAGITETGIFADPALFQAGDNTVTFTVENGEYADLSLYCAASLTEKSYLAESGSLWRYVMAPKAENGSVPDDWMQPAFDDAAWSEGSAPFGDRNNDRTKWSADKRLWLRRTFTVGDPSVYAGSPLFMSIWYDDNVSVYLNGQKLFFDKGWVDAYKQITLAKDAGSALRAGENVIAVSLGSADSYGGSEFDLSLFAERSVAPEDERSSDAPISLEEYGISSQRMCKAFPLSYLVLTGSSANGGKQWVGRNANSYTNWISSMSQCEILKPYSFGAFKSGIIKRLREGHGNLTDAQIRTIACWIDLGVPCYADYEEGGEWSGNLRREYEEKTNKRAFYDMLDRGAKDALGGTALPGTLTVEYSGKDGSKSVSGEGTVILQTGAKYQNGDKLKITLPEGQKYLAVSLSSRMGEAILYLPGGVFEYTFADLDKTYPDTMNPTKSARSYTDNTVSARIPTEKEITESRNLAYNPYDLTEGSAYPHVTADSYYGKQAEFAPRNVIDGFTANDSHGTYPYQSWGTEKSDRHWITVDFGREVTVNELQFFVRADFSGGHDTHFTSAVAEFSDGSEMPVPLYRTANAVCVDLGGRTTTFVKLKNFVRAADTWAAVTEIRILGSEGKASDGTAAASTYGGKVPAAYSGAEGSTQPLSGGTQDKRALSVASVRDEREPSAPERERGKDLRILAVCGTAVLLLSLAGKAGYGFSGIFRKKRSCQSIQTIQSNQ